jgi:hypothetical protein
MYELSRFLRSVFPNSFGECAFRSVAFQLSSESRSSFSSSPSVSLSVVSSFLFSLLPLFLVQPMPAYSINAGGAWPFDRSFSLTYVRQLKNVAKKADRRQQQCDIQSGDCTNRKLPKWLSNEWGCAWRSTSLDTDGVSTKGPASTTLELASALAASIPKSQKQTSSLLNIEVANRTLLQSYAIQQ